MNVAKKILILGGPGSGKSILAFNLSKKLNIPVHHLDEIHVKHDIEKNGKSNRNDDILKILKNDTWIMDGNYRGTLQKRIKECDVIIFLDYPTYKLITGVLTRFIKQICKIEKKLSSNNNKFDFRIIKLAYRWRKEKRMDIIKNLNKTNKKKYIFKSRRKLNIWYKNTFKEDIRRNYYE